MSEMSSIAVNLGIIIFLLLSNGFFVASEFAMVKVRKTRIEQLVNEGNNTAKVAMEALKDLDKFIAAVQLGVTISSIGLGWVGEGTLARIIEPIFNFLCLFYWIIVKKTVENSIFITNILQKNNKNKNIFRKNFKKNP